MREALAARPDDDFVISAPVRRKSAVRPKPRKVGTAERLITLALAHPRHIVAAVFLTGCAGVIAWNALVHQSARHPAPLFTQRELAPTPLPAAPRTIPPARPPADAEPPVAVPFQQAGTVPAAAPPEQAPAKLPARSAIADLIRSGGEPAAQPKPARSATPAPTAVPAPAAAPAPAAKQAASRDPIADMIRMGGPVPTPPANVGRNESSDLVLTGQRALAKLGYGIKADGQMGPGTRQAIERFEQDRHIPVTGEFGARTVRELSIASGILVQ